MQQPMFTPNGDGYDVSPAGVLILAAGTVHGPAQETTPDGIRNAQRLVDGILSAARAGGYAQCEVLETLLAKLPYTPRVGAMAQAACAVISAPAMRAALYSSGL